VKRSEEYVKSLQRANYISNCAGFQVFVGAVCHHVKLQKNEVLTCLVRKMNDYYQISAFIIDKYPNRSYHLTDHTITFLICDEAEIISFETHKSFNAITLSTEQCKNYYNQFIKNYKFKRNMKRDGKFLLKVEINSNNNCVADFKWESE